MRLLLHFISLTLLCASSHQQSTIRPEWQGKAVDIFFMLDASSSVWVIDFYSQRQFVADLISGMDVSPTGPVRVGVGVYVEGLEIVVPVNNSFTKQKVIDLTLQAPYTMGDSYISRAMKGLREKGLPLAIRRPNVPAIGVLITDGSSRQRQLTADYTNLCQKEGIYIATIGVGAYADQRELKDMASDPKADYFYYVDAFKDLASIKDKVSANLAKAEPLLSDSSKCGNTNDTDTVFVYDKTSLGDEGMKNVRHFLKEFINDLSMNSGKARVGIVSKTCHQGDIKLSQYLKSEQLIQGLEDDSGPGITDLVKQAMRYSYKEEFGGRSYALKRVVVIMTKNITARADIIMELLKAKFLKYQVFIIYIGTDYDKEFLNKLATSLDHVLYTSSSSGLAELLTPFKNIFCTGI